MRLVVTGGGTGGHVYPALEIAREARHAGWEVSYLGSLRGQEGRLCERAGLPFQGLPSEPLWSLRRLRGWRSLIRLARASRMARVHLRRNRPDAVFSTGGYAAGPVLHAAAGEGVPYVVHEQNAVPGRSSLLFSKRARCVGTVFRSGEEAFPGARVVRTGMPVRGAFRGGCAHCPAPGHERSGERPVLLVMGGSQGAEALNDFCLATAVRMARARVRWLHVAGPALYEGMVRSKRTMGVDGDYEIRAYLEADDLASAMATCSLTICRSGAGTMAELAAARKPAVLVPYPHAFGDHQTANAREFEAMGAASVIAQRDLDPCALESRILEWLEDAERPRRAAGALAAWDVPDAARRLLELIEEAAG
jgi:UDP-N-acetylglucosamine--N-acetylmuramyl-(pentapeptide) pyrophosphoryl-undecaprenol N-acetylglucosamine transferase